MDLELGRFCRRFSHRGYAWRMEEKSRCRRSVLRSYGRMNWISGRRSNLRLCLPFLRDPLFGLDRTRRGAFLVLVGQLAVTSGLLWVPRVVIDTFQHAAANRRLSKTTGSGVQGGQTLVQTQIFWRLRQGGQQRPQGFGGHVIGNEKLGISQGRADGQSHIVRVALIDKRGGSF